MPRLEMVKLPDEYSSGLSCIGTAIVLAGVLFLLLFLAVHLVLIHLFLCVWHRLGSHVLIRTDDNGIDFVRNPNRIRNRHPFQRVARRAL